MNLELIFDNEKYKIEFFTEANLEIRSNPFFIKYSSINDFEESLSLFQKIKGKKEEVYSSFSKKPLKEIDGLLFEKRGGIKIEVRNGEVYLMGKSIESYLTPQSKTL